MHKRIESSESSKDISQGILFVSCPLSLWMLSTISSKVGSLRSMDRK